MTTFIAEYVDWHWRVIFPFRVVFWDDTIMFFYKGVIEDTYRRDMERIRYLYTYGAQVAFRYY